MPLSDRNKITKNINKPQDVPPVDGVIEESTHLPKRKTVIFFIIAGIFLLILVLFITIRPEKRIGKEKINPTGLTANSIVGPIKKINNASGEVTVLNTRDGKTYRILINNDTPIFEKNIETKFQDLKVNLHVGIYSDNKIADNILNKDYSYIIITGSPIPKTKGNLSEGESPIMGGNK